MLTNLGKYDCVGQMSIFDFMEQEAPEKTNDKIYPVGLIGLCDDPICSNCDYEFSIFDSQWSKNEIDIERCPHCGVRLNWERWHRVNDNE